MENTNKKTIETAADGRDVARNVSTDTHNAAKALTQLQKLENLLDTLRNGMEDLLTISPDSSLTDAERRRLLGSGVRRYGFIDKVSDVATDNPEFVPPFLDVKELKSLIRIIEVERSLSATLRQLLRINNDNLLVTSDTAFQMALMYYNTVRDASRRRVQGAEAIFRLLQLFFRRRRPTSDEPTENEVERDVKALLKGKKDGKIVVENIKPKMVGGVHKVIDEVAGGHAAGKMKVTE